MGSTFHYVDDDWAFCTNTMGMKHFPQESSEPNIHSSLDGNLKEWKADAKVGYTFLIDFYLGYQIRGIPVN